MTKNSTRTPKIPAKAAKSVIDSDSNGPAKAGGETTTASTASLKTGTGVNKRRTTKYHTMRMTLDSPKIGEFGIAAARQTFLFASASGRYSVDAAAEAALRADDNVALPDHPLDGIGAWHARGLAVSVDYDIPKGCMSAAHGDPAYFRGLVQIAREHAVQVARAEAENEGDVFMKLLLAQDYGRFSGLPFHLEVAAYLRQMAERDIDALGIDPETFHERAEKVLRRFK